MAQVNASPATVLFGAVEAGVPTSMVGAIAGATGESAASVMQLIGVSLTTFKRKTAAREPLPDVAGHRVMGLLRIAATLRRLLQHSGGAEQLRSFDLERRGAQWLRQSLPELGGRTPADMLRNPEGQRAVEAGALRGWHPPGSAQAAARCWPCRRSSSENRTTC